MSTILGMLREVRVFVRDVVALCAGAMSHAAHGNTPAYAYQAMIRFFCRTGGRSNDVMTRLVRISGRSVSLPAPRGGLGVSSAERANRIADCIRRDGYFVFEQTLAKDVCDRLLQFALSTPARVRPMKGEDRKDPPGERAVYERRNPLAVRYDFDTGDVLSAPDVQALLTSASILRVAQDYLGSTPIADVISMWWHTGYSDQPDEEAAQFFHFDMDRIKWLKFFIYLTDVGPDNGPHCFVRGSHRTGGIPPSLLAKGYSRLSDEDVSKHYAKEDFIEFVAPRGTVIAEDTRGLHKGLAVCKGDRLMLQLQFSNSLFGGAYPPATFRSMSAPLRDMVRAYPSVYSNYLEHGR